MLVSNPVNVTYLTGFTGDSSYLVLARERAVLVSDGRFTEQIAEECPGLEAAHPAADADRCPRPSAEVLGKLGCRAVGFESGHLTVAELESLGELAPALDWKPRPRPRRAAAGGQGRVEVAADPRGDRHRRAGLRHVPGACCGRDDTREGPVPTRWRPTSAGPAAGLRSFPTIVAVGERAALPHAPPTERSRRRAPSCCWWTGAPAGRFYKSDLTRVLAHSYKFNFLPTGRSGRPKLEEVYAVVLQAQEPAIRRRPAGRQGQRGGRRGPRA